MRGCGLVADGGTMEGLIYMGTVTYMTEQREKELASYLK